ncbi:DnaA/Hda family protein [uncultured Roseobacter sp.]|uniref:DnaA ATPase domain-containing protein n=1 Tax=uncultured Roseobacter sp. TaxID=114847 RepID=UPI002621E1E5|nr:DnaA/Hda family protein [uncultured Roseobacter sp.]
MAEQLGFDLPGVPALGRADFLVAPSNAVAIAMIEGWQGWSGRKLLLSGPEGSGKTHLTQVWAGLSGAQVVAAQDLAAADVPLLATGHIAVEDVHLLSGNSAEQTALFHLHNMVLAEGNSLLLTGCGAPAHWGIDLPDLASRLAGTTVAQLEPPDDALLAALLAKLFSDRQLSPKPEVISYLVRRIDRSFAGAREIVAALDAASLARKCAVTRGLAATLLDKGGPSG